MSWELIKFSQIDPNPYRDLSGNPLRPERLDELVASMEHPAGFWENVLVRRHPTKSGRFQLAHGHARLEAAKRIGLKQAEFPVKELSDHDMIVVMAQENITQLGRDSYATYKEAVVAATTFIMSDIVGGGSAEKFFITSGQGTRNDLIAAINDGGCPGLPIIEDFFRPKTKTGQPDRTKRSTLGVGDIRLALQTFHDTGGLDEWHKEHNPKSTKPQSAPVINPSAIDKFTKTSHVKNFTDAVKKEKVPFADQPKLADQILAKLKDNTETKRRAPQKARQSFDSSVPANERMTGANIRAEVGRQTYAANRSAADQERAETLARMTSCEKALTEIATGLTRASNGFRQLLPIVTILGSLESEMSPLAVTKLRDIREALGEIQTYMARCNSVTRTKD